MKCKCFLLVLRLSFLSYFLCAVDVSVLVLIRILTLCVYLIYIYLFIIFGLYIDKHQPLITRLSVGRLRSESFDSMN